MGEILGERIEECEKNLRDPSGKRCIPSFMRGILLLFYFSTMMTLPDIVLKPLLDMLLSVPLLPTSYSTAGSAAGRNLWGHLLLLLSCLSIKLVYNGDITLPPT